MTRAHGVRTIIPRWMLGAAVCGTMLACNFFSGKDGTPKSNTIGDVRTQLLGEVESNYTFGPERAAVSVDTTIINAPGGTLPTITISSATQSRAGGRVPGNKFISRLTSSDAYPTMGLAPGENYIWRDTSSGTEGPFRTLVVPKNPAYPMYWLRRDYTVASYAPGAPTEPRLVKSFKGFGQCDLNCGPTHCAFQATLRALLAVDSVHITP